ncbi:sugar phosphate isomerase/epimerase family protein [Halegenticoccus soli]|uniref:sugar phosphate isomerase/epimerase family protein n=1 Tax=Halegenticoccus soli TaxID=1985678 RepID=UPI000C6DAD5A|nr:sugar phosphate isomerase/epimerase [Halegenticoccus soli]
MRSAIQLFTVRDIDEPLPDLVGRVASAGYDGIELAGLPDDPVALGDALDDHGIACAGAHVSYDRVDEDPGGVVETVGSFDCESVVVPYLDHDHFASLEALASTATSLERVADRLGSDGCRLFYHNHAHEFGDVNGRTAFDRLIERTSPSVLYELDVGWAAEGGRDPVDLLSVLDGRCPLIHIKDVDLDDGSPAEIGEGDVDLAACVDAAIEAGAEWFIYEHDAPDDPTESLCLGAERLDDLLGR